jgi:hypothetical protein
MARLVKHLPHLSRTTVQVRAFKMIAKRWAGSSADHAAESELDRKARFAQRASVSLRCVDDWMRNGVIPYLKVGRVVLIPWREALETLSSKYRPHPRNELIRRERSARSENGASE